MFITAVCVLFLIEGDAYSTGGRALIRRFSGVTSTGARVAKKLQIVDFVKVLFDVVSSAAVIRVVTQRFSPTKWGRSVA